MSEIKEIKSHSINPIIKKLVDELAVECAAISKIEKASGFPSTKVIIQVSAISLALGLALNDRIVSASNAYAHLVACVMGTSLIGLIYYKDFHNQSAILDQFYNQKLENYLRDIFSHSLTDTDGSSFKTYQALLKQLMEIDHGKPMACSPLFSPLKQGLTLLRRKECVHGYVKSIQDNYDRAFKEMVRAKQVIVKNNISQNKNKNEDKNKNENEIGGEWQGEKSKTHLLKDEDEGALSTQPAAKSPQEVDIPSSENSLVPEKKQPDSPIENIAPASLQLPFDLDSKLAVTAKAYNPISSEQVARRSKKSKNQIAPPHTEDKLINKIKKNIRKGQLEIAKQLATNILYEESWKEIEIYYTHYLSKKLVSSPEKISKQHHAFKIFIIKKGIIERPQDEAKDGKKRSVEEASKVETANVKLPVLRTLDKQKLPPVIKNNHSPVIALTPEPRPLAISDQKVPLEIKKPTFFWVRKSPLPTGHNLSVPSLSTASTTPSQEAKGHTTELVTVSESELPKSTLALLNPPSIAQVSIVQPEIEEKKRPSDLLKQSSCSDRLLKLKYTIESLIALRVNCHKISSPPLFYFPENILLLAIGFQYEFTRIGNNLHSIPSKNFALFLHGGLVRDFFCRRNNFIGKREADIDLITPCSIKELILILPAMQEKYPGMNFCLKYQRGDTGLIKATYQGVGIDFQCFPGLLRGEFPNTDYNYNDTVISLTTLGIVDTGKPSVIAPLIDGALGITRKIFTASKGYLSGVPIKTLIPHWDNLVRTLSADIPQINIRELEEILKNWIDNIIRILRMAEKFYSEQLLSMEQMTLTQKFCLECSMIMQVVLDAAARKDLSKKIYFSPSDSVEESKYKKSLIAIAPQYFDKIVCWLMSKDENLFAINLYEYFIKFLLKEFCTNTHLREKIDQGFLFLKSFDHLAIHINAMVKTRNLQPIDYGLPARILPWAVAMVMADKSKQQHLMADKAAFTAAVERVIIQIPFFHKAFLESISIEHPKISSESLTAMIEKIYDNLCLLDKKNTLSQVNKMDKLTEFFRLKETADHKSGEIAGAGPSNKLMQKDDPVPEEVPHFLI